MAIRGKLLEAKARARIAARVAEARQRGVPDDVLAWFERVVRNYEMAAVEYGAVLVTTASALSTVEMTLRSSIETKDVLERRIRELEDRIRLLEVQLAVRRQSVVVPFARRPRLRRVDTTTTQARR